MIGDWLYQLRPRDEQLDPIAFVHFTRQRAVAAAQIDQTFIVPQDRLFLLQTLYLVWGAGGAYNAQSWSLLLEDAKLPPFSGIYTWQLREVLSSASGVRGITLPQQIIIPPERRIATRLFFDSGAAVNVYDIGFSGYMIPRGNVSFTQLIVEQ